MTNLPNNIVKKKQKKLQWISQLQNLTHKTLMTMEKLQNLTCKTSTIMKKLLKVAQMQEL